LTQNLLKDNFKLYFKGDHFGVGLDVTSSESVQKVFDEVVNKYKRTPNTIINCAGITRDNFILKMNEEDFDVVLKVNLKVSKKYVVI
jgi:17beta-estradiol 17-dehydrogenase / 3alpha(17beta)-hydroxysteroid dehydrogenase (NAD+) / 3-oxoacyl-[acyl-carrier protein] reductase alpha subunit